MGLAGPGILDRRWTLWDIRSKQNIINYQSELLPDESLPGSRWNSRRQRIFGYQSGVHREC